MTTGQRGWNGQPDGGSSGLGNSNRLGLTYSYDRESLFFAYAISGGYAISEMEFDVVSLSRDTWAGIKSSF